MAPIKHTPQHGPRKNGPNKIVVTATSVALVSAFSVGAFALGQGGADFDPSAFQSAYNQGQDDQRTGYRTSTTDTQAQANRKDDGSSDPDTGAETKRKNDSFSQLPAGQQSGSTSYRVTGNGGSNVQTVTVNGGNPGNTAAGTGTGNTPSGPVVPGDGNTNGAGAGTGGNTTSGTNPGDSGSNGGGTGGNTSDNTGGNTGDNTGGADFTPNNPVKPSNRVDFSKDPTVTKPGLGSGSAPVVNRDPKLNDLTIDDGFVAIYQASDPYLTLYAGQKPTKWQVFCALTAQFIWFDDDDFCEYEWTTSEEKFGLYDLFEIVDYPEVIPDPSTLDGGTFEIKVRYRLKSTDDWTEGTVQYEPQSSKTYIISNKVGSNGEPSVLGAEPGMTGSDGETTHLLRYTESLLKAEGLLREDGSQTELVMGWADEDGNEVPYPFIKKLEPGRHYLQPSSYAEISDGYIVKPDSFWVDSRSYADDGFSLVYLQTLTGLANNGRALPGRTLTVPTGINAIKFGDDQSSVVDVVSIPSTVLRIDMTSEGLLVNKKFEVASDNPNYTTTEDGILTNKEQEKSGEDQEEFRLEYLAVPLEKTSLTVPQNVKKVHLSKANKLKTLVLEAKTAYLPDIELDNLKNCNVVVDDEAFDDFVMSNYKVLSAGKNTVAKASNPNERFYVDDGMIYSEDKLYRVFDTGLRDLFVDGPHTFLKDCLSGNGSVRSITLMDDKPYVLEDGCFANSALTKIVCQTQEQYDYVKSHLDAAGVPDAEVVLGLESKEGHRYVVVDDGGDQKVVLLKAASGIKTFAGELTSADGTKLDVTEIGPRAFADERNLKWVNLPESVTEIGDEAFKGCSVMEGLFVACPDYVHVGNSAIAELDSLRFVAFRAYDAEFDTWDNPNPTCLMYAPTYNVGYTSYFQSFTEDSNVADYEVTTLSDGTLVLYGTYINGPWLLLATGSQMPAKVDLPTSTREIFNNAFEGAKGPFEINWSELDQLQFIDYAAFKDSDLKGDVVVGTSSDQWVKFDVDSFYGCNGITSLESKATDCHFYSGAFNECGSLERVKFGAGDLVSGGSMTSSLFYKCNKLQSIEFTSEFPIDLTLYGEGSPFVFNSDWGDSGDEESERLKIVVSDKLKDKCLKKWVYPMAGYSSYDNLYSKVLDNLRNTLFEYPSEAQIKREMSRILLDSENRLRTMMGMEKVDVSTFLPVDESEGYVFVTQDGVTRLESAPEDATVVDLEKVKPERIKSFVVSKDAFKDCKQLERVTVPECVSEIESGAFEGHDGLDVSITSSKVKLPMDGNYLAFTFGANIKLSVPDAIRNDCLAAWPMQSYVADDNGDGIDEDDLMWYVFMLWDDSIGSVDELDQAVNGPFMDQENYFRKLMGLDEITDTSQLAYRYDVGAFFAEQKAKKDQGKPVVASEKSSDSDKGDSSAKDAESSASTDKKDSASSGKDKSASEADGSSKADSSSKKDSASGESGDKKTDSSSKSDSSDSSSKATSDDPGDAAKGDSLQNPNAKDAGQSGITE